VQAFRQRGCRILNEGRAHPDPARQRGNPAGQGPDAFLRGWIPAAMRDSQQHRAHDEPWPAGTTPVNFNRNARAQLAQRQAPPSGPSGRRSVSPQYGQ
jgi:hypothetical protein